MKTRMVKFFIFVAMVICGQSVFADESLEIIGRAKESGKFLVKKGEQYLEASVVCGAKSHIKIHKTPKIKIDTQSNCENFKRHLERKIESENIRLVTDGGWLTTYKFESRINLGLLLSTTQHPSLEDEGTEARISDRNQDIFTDFAGTQRPEAASAEALLAK